MPWDENGSFSEDVLIKKLELYKSKHPKQSFIYVYSLLDAFQEHILMSKTK
jgi:hypothetical protein